MIPFSMELELPKACQLYHLKPINNEIESIRNSMTSKDERSTWEMNRVEEMDVDEVDTNLNVGDVSSVVGKVASLVLRTRLTAEFEREFVFTGRRRCRRWLQVPVHHANNTFWNQPSFNYRRLLVIPVQLYQKYANHSSWMCDYSKWIFYHMGIQI